MVDDLNDSLTARAEAIDHDPGLLLAVSPAAQRTLLQLTGDAYEATAQSIAGFVLDIVALATEGRVRRLCNEQNQVLRTFLERRGSRLWIRAIPAHVGLRKGERSESRFVVTEVVLIA